jgi:hypothetical protein
MSELFHPRGLASFRKLQDGPETNHLESVIGKTEGQNILGGGNFDRLGVVVKIQVKANDRDRREEAHKDRE